MTARYGFVPVVLVFFCLLVAPSSAYACSDTALGTPKIRVVGSSVRAKALVATTTNHLSLRMEYTIGGAVVRTAKDSAEYDGGTFGDVTDRFRVHKWWRGRRMVEHVTVTDGSGCTTTSTASVVIPR